jgi:hypothetical protein
MSDVPAWVDHPSTPEWAKASKYHDALNAADVLEVQRGGLSKGQMDQRLYRRKYNAKQAQKRTEGRAAETRERRTAREQCTKESLQLNRLHSAVKRWRSKIEAGKTAEPGSMLAAHALVSMSSWQQQLQWAEREFDEYVTAQLRAELARDE